MSTRIFLPVGLLAAAIPLVSQAQDAPASSPFYVGAGINLFTNVPFNSSWAPRLFGPSLLVGRQLTPRLALQTGVSYHWKTESYSYSYNFGQTPLVRNISNRYSYLQVPVLLRYTLASSANGFYLDGLGGINVLYAASRYRDSATADIRQSYTRASITLGPAMRYSFSPRMQFTANALVSAVIGNSYYRFSDRLFLNALVGVQYSFGQS